MHDLIVRDVQVKIAPTVYEIAKLIWDMNADEQSFLLHLLAKKFNNDHGYEQMAHTSESVVKNTYDAEVGHFVDNLQKFLGYVALKIVRTTFTQRSQ